MHVSITRVVTNFRFYTHTKIHQYLVWVEDKSSQVVNKVMGGICDPWLIAWCFTTFICIHLFWYNVFFFCPFKLPWQHELSLRLMFSKASYHLKFRSQTDRQTGTKYNIKSSKWNKLIWKKLRSVHRIFWINKSYVKSKTLSRDVNV